MSADCDWDPDYPDREGAVRSFGEPVRRCARCAEWLPDDREFFPLPGVPGARCLACHAEVRRRRRGPRPAAPAGQRRSGATSTTAPMPRAVAITRSR